MAKKPSTPKPPRPVPKARPARRTPDERRTRTILLVFGALGLVGVAVVAGLLAFGGSTSAAATLRDAGCTLTTVPALTAGNHVQEPPEPSAYNTWPPTSGPHYPAAAPFGIYDEPVQQFRLVHNLEHGGVVIQYGDDVPQAQVDALTAWYRDNPTGVVVAPLPALGDRIALAAWTADVNEVQGEVTNQQGRLAKCAGFDAGAFDAFVDAYGFKGPERFTKEMLQPGS